MDEFEFHRHGRIPEHVDIAFNTTGFCGGDAGHGGFAELRIGGEESRDIFVQVRTSDGRWLDCEDATIVSITVRGDWEIEGLALALFELGKSLMSQTPVVKISNAWHEEEKKWQGA